MKQPERINDCEILPDTTISDLGIVLYSKDCIGASKYDRDMMLVFKHDHHTNNGETGIVDVMLTIDQAKRLIQLLSDEVKKFPVELSLLKSE